ncbi:hypothetical protein OG474_22645 [Kribbella sp. NBC_01505]|uniref:hypothetical protein n=1 Tax=Kribbella sp. NBC_01505 TaxID=2903580 RepID=UPI00386DC6EF
MLTKNWWAAMAAMVCATLVVTACAGDPSDGKSDLIEPSQVSLPNPLPAVTWQSTLPYDDLTLSAKERDRLHLAYNKLVEVCAKRFGTTLTRVEDDPEALGPEFALWAGRFGTLPLEQAKKYGYHAAPGEPVTKPWAIFTDEDEQPVLGVLQGEFSQGQEVPRDSAGSPVPSGGCRGEAAKKVGGDPNALGPENAEELRLAALHDPRTVAASEQWSSCMRARGYKYAKLDGPIDEALGKRLAEPEKLIAVADVGCTRTSRWRDISFAIERGLQMASIDVHRDKYEASLKAERHMLERAEALAAEAND